MIYDIFSKPIKKISQKKFSKIEIDFREKNSLVPTKLLKLNHKIEFKELKVADYIINNIAIERKTAQDFIQSMINGRLKKQIKEIKQYSNHILILEGELNKTEFKNKNALKGFILSIIINHKIPIIFTKNEEETATYISLLAKRKQNLSPINPKKAKLSQKEQLEYILQSFPKIGPTKSKQLLKKFKTLKKIFQEKEENLKPILNKNAFQFISLLNSKYN
jgi:Fanconi anemia group M protein